MKRVLVIFVFVLLLGGCMLDPYRNSKNAKDAVYAWFSYDEDGSTLGEMRRKNEYIKEIKDVSCDYVCNDDYKRYIYKCNIKFVASGKTVIPLAKDEEIDSYVALIYNDDRTYEYIVYNSDYKEGVWTEDRYLNYGNSR